jgi:uncharacterized damage-inducible protein DinB
VSVSRVTDLWDRIRKGLIDTIDKFTDEDLDYIPFPNGYSVRQIMLHIAQEEYGEIQYGITRTIDAFPPQFRGGEYPTVRSVQELLARVHEGTDKYMRSLDDEEFGKEIDAPWGERKPQVDFILHVIEHEIHHRGELSLILGLLGRQGLDA